MKKETKDKLKNIGLISLFFGFCFIGLGAEAFFENLVEEPGRVLLLVLEVMAGGAVIGALAVFREDIQRFFHLGTAPQTAPSASSRSFVNTSVPRCCICGRNMVGQPIMQDRMTGAVYCRQHSGYFDALKDPSLFSSCARCGFKYSRHYSEFAKGDSPSCPSCGASLK